MSTTDLNTDGRRNYAESSLKWDAAVAAGKTDDELLQRIWNLAEDSLALVAALDRIEAERDAAVEREYGTSDALAEARDANGKWFARAEAAEAALRDAQTERDELAELAHEGNEREKRLEAQVQQLKAALCSRTSREGGHR